LNSHDYGAEYLKIERDTPKSRRVFGLGEDFLLTFGFKDAAAKVQARHYAEIELFESIPGIGFIHAATVSAIIETPHRFATKSKAWMYAGLGIMKKTSGGKVYTEKLSTDYNRQLKYTLKQAAETAIRAKENPFRRKYLDMTLLRGVVPHRARLTIARDILATMLAMWRKGEIYNPEIREKAKAHKQVQAC
jgi:transposase